MRGGAALLAALALSAAPADEHPLFRWPLIGKISKSPDGHGVEIAAPVGEPVHAAGDGEAIYAGEELASFGKMVVVRHAGGYVTAYAHLSDMAVKQGDKVRRGQVIGKAGQSGDAKRPGLHFELREGSTNLDPLGYLTPR